MAFLTFFVNHLACTAAVGARTDIDHLAKGRILYDPLLACAVADRASIYLAARFGAFDFIFGYLDFHFRPKSSLFERNVYVETEVCPPFRTVRLTAALATEEGIKDIAKTAKATLAKAALAETAKAAETTKALAGTGSVAVLEGIHAELVVLGALVLIRQDAVGFVDFLELFFCSLRVVPVFIRMVLYSQFTEGFLNIRFAGIFGNAKYFIIISFAHMGSPSLSTYFWSSSTTL